MASQVSLQLAVGQIPDLDQPVPASRHYDGLVSHRREADAGHPLGVALSLCDCELALSQSVPKLDGLVSGARDNLQSKSLLDIRSRPAFLIVQSGLRLVENRDADKHHRIYCITSPQVYVALEILE